jgi:hypothetical protein
MIRRLLILAVLAVSLTIAPACAPSAFFHTIGSIFVPVDNPATLAALQADTISSVAQLGEWVRQIAHACHSLHTLPPHLVPLTVDDPVQLAASHYADTQDATVVKIQSAHSRLDILAATVPLIGDATSVLTPLRGIKGTSGLTSTGALFSLSLPNLISQADDVLKKLGGK